MKISEEATITAETGLSMCPRMKKQEGGKGEIIP